MRKNLIKFLFLTLIAGLSRTAGHAEDFALKSNVLYWGTTTPNLSAELGVAPKWTIELMGAYNP